MAPAKLNAYWSEGGMTSAIVQIRFPGKSDPVERTMGVPVYEGKAMTCQCTRLVGELHPCTNEAEPGTQLCDCCRLCHDLGGICSAPYVQGPAAPHVEYEKTRREDIETAIDKSAEDCLGV
jgi:hypothetical protein